MATQTPAAEQPRSDQPRMVFFMPPPVTVWMQLDNGMQVAFSPTVTMPSFSSGSSPSFWSSMQGGFNQFLHDLFQRSQDESHGPPPTSKEFLSHLPVKTWSTQSAKMEAHSDCAICLSDYEDNDVVLSLPCGHQFHKDCGLPWLQEHNVCPTCRHKLPTQESSAPPEQEPEQEPATVAEPQSEQTVGVRRPLSPRTRQNEEQDRNVRQRTASFSMTEEEMESMMDEEADKLLEAYGNERDDDIDDADVEELLHDL